MKDLSTDLQSMRNQANYSPFKPFSFHSRESEIMAPIITLRWKQAKQYMAIFTGDSVEQITVPILYDIIYKTNLICIAKTIDTPQKGVNPI